MKEKMIKKYIEDLQLIIEDSDTVYEVADRAASLNTAYKMYLYITMDENMELISQLTDQRDNWLDRDKYDEYKEKRGYKFKIIKGDESPSEKY